MYKTLFFSLIIMLLIPVHIHAEDHSNVEIYDIEQDKIIKTLPVTPAIISKTELYLKNINDIYKKFKPMPRKGLLVRVPLDPSVSVKNNWVNTSVNEVIFIIPSNEPPLLLTFDKENTPYFFTFTKNINDFLEELN